MTADPGILSVIEHIEIKEYLAVSIRLGRHLYPNNMRRNSLHACSTLALPTGTDQCGTSSLDDQTDFSQRSRFRYNVETLTPSFLAAVGTLPPAKSIAFSITTRSISSSVSPFKACAR